MSSSESPAWLLPRCVDTNATCAEKVAPFFPPFSSTFALTLLGLALIGLVSLSLSTYHYHKSKMKRRKMERAEEEYERDRRSPVPRGKPDFRRCVIARPASTGDQPNASPPKTSHAERVEAGALESVAVS